MFPIFLRVSKPRSGAGTCRHGELLHITFQTQKKAAAYATALLRGTDGARTHDLPHVKRTLIPAELRFHILLYSEKESGTDGARTRDLSRVRRTLIPAELRFHDPVRFSLTSPSEYLCILLH